MSCSDPADCSGAEDALSEEPTVYQDISFCFSAALLAVGTLGVIGNLLSIFIFLQRQMRVHSINILLCGLSITDLCVVLLAIPSFGLTGIGSYYQDQTALKWYTYIIFAVYPMAMTAQACSVWLFVVITFERFNAVCHPMAARRFTARRAFFSLTAILAASILYNIVRIYEYEPPADEEDSIGQIKPLLKGNPLYMKLYFSGMYLVFLFLIPFSLLAILNGYIIRIIRKTTLERKTMSRQQVTEHNTTIMMIIITLLFAVCNTLAFALNIAEAISPSLFVQYYSNNGSDSAVALATPIYNDTAYVILDLSNFLVVANSSTTFLVYLAFSQRYREICKYLFLRYICCRRHPLYIPGTLTTFLGPGTQSRVATCDSPTRQFIKRPGARTYLLCDANSNLTRKHRLEAIMLHRSSDNFLFDKPAHYASQSGALFANPSTMRGSFGPMGSDKALVSCQERELINRRYLSTEDDKESVSAIMYCRTGSM